MKNRKPKYHRDPMASLMLLSRAKMGSANDAGRQAVIRTMFDRLRSGEGEPADFDKVVMALNVASVRAHEIGNAYLKRLLSGGHKAMAECRRRYFDIDRECELKSCDEEKAVVKYGRHPLDIEEVRNHINFGKLPTKLALTWDDRVSIVLTEGLQVRKLKFLDAVFEGKAHDDGGFDADVSIATGELSKLIPDLIEALGGEA